LQVVLGEKKMQPSICVKQKRDKKEYMIASCTVVWWLTRCILHLSAKPRPLSRTNELIMKVTYVRPLQAEEFKYYKATYWKNLYLNNQKKGWVRIGGILWGVVIIFSHLNQIFQLEFDLAIPLAATHIESKVAFPNLQPNIELDESQLSH